MPGWVYSNSNGLTQGEQQVRGWDNGKYPWVSTSTFAAGATLPYHSHHGDNTHLIVQGSMLLRKRLSPQDERLYTLGDRINIKPLESYGSHSTRDGCNFVEGHAILSPRTRDRFILRRNIVWDATGNNAGPVQGRVIQDGDVTVRVMAAARRNAQRSIQCLGLVLLVVLGATLLLPFFVGGTGWWAALSCLCVVSLMWLGGRE